MMFWALVIGITLNFQIVYGEDRLTQYPVDLGFSASKPVLGGGIFNSPAEIQFPLSFEFFDQRKKDEIQCPGGIFNPATMGFTLVLPDGIFTGSAKFKNGNLTEFAGIKTEKKFLQTQYISSSSVSTLAPSSNASTPPAPSAGTRIGELNSTTIQVFMNTNTSDPNFGKIKTYQYRFEKQPNVQADFSKKEPALSDIYYGSMTTVASLLSSYQTCCPNEALEPCLKKIKISTQDKIEATTAKKIKANTPNFKDTPPFSPTLPLKPTK